MSNKSYEFYEHKEGDVVYCDIPYESAAEYVGGFNHKAFYDWCYNADFPVWFSSYEISDSRFECVWQTGKRSLLSSNLRELKAEKIYANAKAFEISMNLNTKQQMELAI